MAGDDFDITRSNAVVVHLFDEITDFAAIGEISDIYREVRGLLAHVREFNRNEDWISDQQIGMVKDGCFMMPSPFGTVTADTCSTSYFIDHKTAYYFESQEEYFWVTAPLDRAYCLAVLYFPRRAVAISLYPFVIDEAGLRRVADLYARTEKPPSGPPMIVIGFPQMMHVLWNEIPALERAAESGILLTTHVSTLYQPFGPLDLLYPQLEHRLHIVRHDQLDDLNSAHRLLVALGAWTIQPDAQRRIHDVSRRLCSISSSLESEEFRKAHSPIFWISVKPPKRTFVMQADVLSDLVLGLDQAYPNAGFILNGTSSPWDAGFNQNYGGWFPESMKAATEICNAIVDDMRSKVGTDIASRTRMVSGVSVCDEVVWGGVADFYVCHGGTMQNKIGWMHRIPGFIHSNFNFIDVFRKITPVQDGPACFYPSQGLIEDCPIEMYNSFEKERKDQDYRLVDKDRFLQEVLSAIGASVNKSHPEQSR